jgi:hypothetical protein
MDRVDDVWSSVSDDDVSSPRCFGAEDQSSAVAFCLGREPAETKKLTKLNETMAPRNGISRRGRSGSKSVQVYGSPFRMRLKGGCKEFVTLHGLVRCDAAELSFELASALG